MDPQSNDFQFGKLTAELSSLHRAVSALTGEVKTLAHEVGEIKLFRAKVLGMAVGASAIVSVLSAIISHAVQAWAK